MANFQVELPDGRKFKVEGVANPEAAYAAIEQMMAQKGGQQGGQQQPAAPQQDDRSFPRAIADVGASFAGAVPKAAGAMVSIGSQVPVLNKVADPIAQSLMNAGEFVDDALLSDYQKNMNADMANAVAKSAIQLGPDATISDHIENMKSQGGAAAKFIMENPSQALMLTSQALPYLVGGGIIGRGVAKLAPSTAGATAGAIGEGSIAAGAVTGDIIAQLEAEGIEGYTPDRLAALPAGVLTAVIGRMGAKVNQKLGGADVDTSIAGGGTGAATRGLSPKGAAIGGGVEMGEEFLQSAQEQAFTNIGTGDPISDEVGSSAVQGAAAGFGMGSVMGSNVFNRDGSPRNPTDLQIAQRAAAGDVARSLRKTAEDNEYNLGDIDPTSGYGAKQALEDYRRGQVTGIVNLVKSLKSQLDPKQAQTLEQLLQDYVPAEAGITASKRKVSAKVTTDQFDAVKRLVAGTQEGDTLLQELQKSNIVTDLFKDGMKGGVSKFTDLFNPLMTGGQSYDPTRVGNVVVGGLPLLSTGGQSLIPQAAIVLGGQAIDKVLGGKGGTRRKLVERFVKLNEGNDGLGRPTGPSLIAQAQQAQQDEEQKAETEASLKEAVRRFRSERGGPEPDSAPLGMLYMGTGLDRSGLEQLLPHLEQHYGDRPEVTELINQTRRNLAGENNQITGLTDWISILNSVLSSDATIDGLRIAEPDGNDARNQRRLAGFGPSAAQSSAGTAQQQQQPQGRSPAVQQGIDDNRAQLEKLRQGLAANKSLTPAERGRLLTALDELQYNLGSDPAVAAMDVVSKLKSDGISESLINRHIMPYVERVLRQQARSGRRQQPPTSTGGTDLAFDEDFDASKPALTDNVPTGEVSGTPLENSLARSFDFARRKVYTKGRDFKLDLQAKSLASQKSAGIDLTQVTPENIDRLADFVYADALEAIKDNQNAIGWYDRTVTEALETLGEVYPEVLTSPKHKLQFVWALAVTSNGLKVDKNFELAAEVYETLQRTGRFPSKAGIGTAAKGINSGLKMYHTMLDKFDGDHVRLADFMNSQVPVRTIEKEYKVDVTGEGKGTLVRGASILGPKIGNGFFSNLYGNFDALTMDRWLMRTVGRWRGTLVVPNPAMEKKKRGEIKDLINGLSNAERRVLRKLYSKAPVTIKPNMSVAQLNAFAQATAKLSMDPAWREVLNLLSPEIRKSGNGLSGYLDGQQEAPKGAAERNFIREVFTRALGRLQDEPAIRQNSNQQLTMSDLQALLWYPEKRLYDTAKQTEGNESRGYEDDDAPDYANAARKVVEAIKQRDGLGSLSGDGRGGRGPAGPDAGQSFDQDLAQQGNTGVLATPPAQQPQQQSPFNMKSLVNKMLGSQPATPDQVKAQLPELRAVFEIGKKGTKYENGIQDIDTALALAKALNITVKMFDDQKAMISDYGQSNSEMVRGAFRRGQSNQEGTVWGLNPNAVAPKLGVITDLYSVTTLLHEIGHGIATGPSGFGFTNEIDAKGYNDLTGQRTSYNSRSFESALLPYLEIEGAKNKSAIVKELINLQDKVKVYLENNPQQKREIRTLASAIEFFEEEKKNTAELIGSKAFAEDNFMQQVFKDHEKKLDNHRTYIRSLKEIAVDPVWVYLANPKLAKKVMPLTAKVLQEQFRNAQNPRIQFFSYPFATIVAVVLAMLLNGRTEEEEEEQMRQQQMPAGALSPQAGALSQQQFAA